MYMRKKRKKHLIGSNQTKKRKKQKERKNKMTRVSCYYIILMIIIVNICMIEEVAKAQEQEGNTTSKRLKIAVPVKEGFREFADVKFDPTTKEPQIEGFSIELFKAVVNSAMPEPFDYDLVPFAKADGSMNGSYDDMLKAVYNGDYDAAVGDISIRYYRTEKWVDFTMPYSDSGVSMLVPSQQKKNNNSESSLSKLSKALIGAAAAVCFLCLVAAFLPRFIDSGEREPKRTRLVIAVCFLIGVVLTACFTLIVISLVTTQRPTPTARQNNVDYLMRKRRNVGHQIGSFVRNELIERGFLESQLLPFSTIDQLLEMLNKGTEQGGIDAAIEETSQLKLFLNYHCSGFNLVHSADLYGDGLSFAFSKGSDLVQDVSVAILKVTNNYEQLRNITRKTIGNLDECVANTIPDYNIPFGWKPTQWILIVGGISVVFLVIILILGCLNKFN